MANDSRATVGALRRPTAKITDAVDALRAMLDMFRLATSTADARSILNGVLDCLASLVDHDALGVYVVDASGQRLRHSLMRGCDNDEPDLNAPLEQRGAVGQVLATGQRLSLTGDALAEMSTSRPCARSRTIVPIVTAGQRILGALDVWSDLPGGYDDHATALLEIYGRFVAVAIENARLSAEVEDKRRFDSDLVVARRVMADLLPHVTPRLPGFDIAAAHESSLAVGGDYYEFIPLREERWGVVIADVVGKGIAAALLVSAIRASIFSLVGHELAVRAIMRRANRFFHESVEEGRFVTLFYAVLDVPARRMIYVNAGHNPPVLLRATGSVEFLHEGGVPLGLFEAPRYFEGHAAFNDRDLLALYTDGIVETMDTNEIEYGSDRFIKTLARAGAAGAAAICGAVMQDVRRFGTAASQDDRTLVIIKATGKN